jgi:pyruvate dehydrogenase (quinone)
MQGPRPPFPSQQQPAPGETRSGSGMMATMTSAVPYAIAAALAFPGRQVVAFTGDGGLAMLLGELAAVTRYKCSPVS